jgi:hypothetical protein
VRASSTIALGCGARTSARRSRARRSSTKASKTRPPSNLGLAGARRAEGGIVRDQPPRRPGAHTIQRMASSRKALAPSATVFAQEGEVRGDQGPFLIGNITGVGFAARFGHPPYSPAAALVHDRL